jgi:hypothetical protein
MLQSDNDVRILLPASTQCVHSGSRDGPSMQVQNWLPAWKAARAQGPGKYGETQEAMHRYFCLLLMKQRR